MALRESILLRWTRGAGTSPAARLVRRLAGAGGPEGGLVLVHVCLLFPECGARKYPVTVECGRGTSQLRDLCVGSARETWKGRVGIAAGLSWQPLYKDPPLVPLFHPPSLSLGTSD